MGHKEKLLGEEIPASTLKGGLAGNKKTMKEATTTTRAIGYLQKIFRQLNSDFFNNEITEPMITIENTSGAYGHVTVGKVWREKDGKERRELNISAGSMARPIENVVATIIHEMSHLYAMQNMIDDTSNNGVYHNKKFKEIAEKDGLLEIGYIKTYGWAITNPTEKLIDYIVSIGWEDIGCERKTILPSRIAGGGIAGGGIAGGGIAKPKTNVGNGTSSTRKYICPCCKNSVRATKDVYIICGDCQMEMKLA